MTLSSMGWQDFFCIMWVVAVGFLYTFYANDELFLLTVMPRKFRYLLCSFSKVNLWILLPKLITESTQLPNSTGITLTP